MNDEPKFAIVPHELTAHGGIEPTTKMVLIHCLERYQTKLENGEPWTFSAPSISKGTGLLDRTVRRQVSELKKLKVLNLYGTMTNGKRRYEVFTFDRKRFDAWIGTADKKSVVVPHEGVKITADIMSAVNPNKNGGLSSIPEKTADITADKSADIKCDRSKIIKGRSVAVGQQERFEGIHSERSEGENPLVVSISAEGGQECLGQEIGVLVPSTPSKFARGDSGTNGSEDKTMPSIPERSEDRAEGDGSPQRACPDSEGSAPGLRFAVSDVEPLELFMPWNVPITPCAKRQDEIVRQMNRQGFSFIKEHPMYSEIKGHKVCAFDPEEKMVLLTADRKDYAHGAHVQKLCAELMPSGWTVLLWTAKDQSVFNIRKVANKTLIGS